MGAFTMKDTCMLCTVGSYTPRSDCLCVHQSLDRNILGQHFISVNTVLKKGKLMAHDLQSIWDAFHGKVPTGKNLPLSPGKKHFAPSFLPLHIGTL